MVFTRISELLTVMERTENDTSSAVGSKLMLASCVWDFYRVCYRMCVHARREGCCWWCCSHINLHNQAQGRMTSSSHSGMEYRKKSQTKQKVVHAHIITDSIHAPARKYRKWSRESAYDVLGLYWYLRCITRAWKTKKRLRIVLLSHINSCPKSRVRGHTKVRWSYRKIRKTQWSQNSSGQYCSFPPITHDTRRTATRENV